MDILAKDHGRPDCIQAKNAEIENLLNFGTFSEVEDTGQNMITSGWILNNKFIYILS